MYKLIDLIMKIMKLTNHVKSWSVIMRRNKIKNQSKDWTNDKDQMKHKEIIVHRVCPN